MAPSTLRRARHSLDQVIEWIASALYALEVFGGLALAARAVFYMAIRVFWIPYPSVLSLLYMAKFPVDNTQSVWNYLDLTLK